MIQVTNGVYRILWNGISCSGGGILTKEQFRELLTNRNLPTVEYRYHYDGDEPNYILEIMRKFQRAYVLKDDRIFIPELMGVSPPPMQMPEGRSIRYTWLLKYLPLHLLHRVMLALYEHCDGAIWRRGIRLRAGEDVLLMDVDPDERQFHLTIWRPEQEYEEPCGIFLDARLLLLDAVADMRLVLEKERIYIKRSNGAIGDYEFKSLLGKYSPNSTRVIDNTEGEDWQFQIADLIEPLFGKILLAAAAKLSKLGDIPLIQALNNAASVRP